MRTVNLLVAILMPYLVRSFYEHSIPKLLRAYLSVSPPPPRSAVRGRDGLIWLKYYGTEMANYI